MQISDKNHKTDDSGAGSSLAMVTVNGNDSIFVVFMIIRVPLRKWYISKPIYMRVVSAGA